MTQGPTLSFVACVMIGAGAALTSATTRKEDNDKPCRSYLAPSTIPGAGLGIFAGVDFEEDDVVMTGDIVVPLDEMRFHTGINEGVQTFLLWGDYLWDSNIVGVNANFDYEGLSGFVGDNPNNASIVEGVEMMSFGLGAMPNCKFGRKNVYSEAALADTANEDRNSPGNGAFTPYHDRAGIALEPILQGSEIFEDYGHSYFADRPEFKDKVLHEEDYASADEILKSLGKLRKDLSQRGKHSKLVTSMIWDLYDMVKSESSWISSRVMNALPNQPPQKNRTDVNKYEYFLDLILHDDNPSLQFEKMRSIRGIKWLQEKGICMDGLHAGTSSIPYAGRGAFATRGFRKSDRIAPVPLMHLPQKSLLTKYAREMENGKATDKRNTSKPIGRQLLLNYCFGHKNSTMLLSPYGHVTSLVNHGSGQDANARLVWAKKWMRDLKWLNMPPEELEHYHQSGLGFELVALRDIEEGEEVLIDYGSHWEEAWVKHLADWYAQEKIPTGTSLPYVPAKELNEDIEQVLLEALKNNIDYSYMGHGVSLHCYIYGSALDEVGIQYIEAQECRPVKAHKRTGTGEQLFVAEIVEWRDNGQEWEEIVLRVIFDEPPSAFFFKDTSYNTAHQMPWSFRHAVGIPEDMFPKAWMNLLA